MYVLLLALALLMIFPMVATVADSFMPGWEVEEYLEDSSENNRIKLIPSEVTVEQYDTVMISNYKYWDYFWNSVIITLPAMLGQIIVSAMAAYCFTVMKSKFKEWLFFGYIIVMLLPFQVTLVPMYLSINALGLYNSRLALILPGIFSTFGTFLLRQHMEQIPKSYIDAAKMDGAGHFRIFTNIVLPMCKASIAALAILSFIDNWNMIEQPLIFIRDEVKQPLSLVFYNINSQAITIAFAASVLYMLPIVLVFLNGQKELMEGIKISGIK